MTSLSDIYGHEENLSKAISASASFEELLNICGVVSTDKSIFETRVDRGHDGREGRIDIIQPTTAGVVIVEVQYGTSDSSHARRLQNYASNFRRPAFVIWIAEEFRKEHIAIFEQAKTPVLCAKVIETEDGLTLRKASPIFWTKQTQAKRVKEAHKKCVELMEKLFSGQPSTYCYEKGFIPMQRFFGQTTYTSLSKARKDRYRDRYKGAAPRNKAWDFEANVEAIIEWYLQGHPKKTQFYLLKHSSFIQAKEQWKDEMACHWMLCNLSNDHPYLDMSYETDKLVRRLDHESRDGRWFWDRSFFAYQRLNSSEDPYCKLFQLEQLAELIQEEHLSGYSLGMGASIMAYAWDNPRYAGIKNGLLQSASIDTGIPQDKLQELGFLGLNKIVEFKQKLLAEHQGNNEFPLDNTLYRVYKEELRKFVELVLAS